MALQSQLQKYVKPKFVMYGLSLLFLIFGAITVPRSISAEMLFLKNIEPGSFEFINTLGLIRETFFILFFSGLYIAMIGVMALVVNINLKEIAAFLVFSTIIAFLLLGVPGLFVITLIYYFHETKEFAKKMRQPEPGTVSSIGLSMTFIIIGLLAGVLAARGNIYFQPEGLDFTSGFGRVWFGCSSNVTVRDCVRINAKDKIGYTSMMGACERDSIRPEVQMSCTANVDNLLNDEIQKQINSYKKMGDIEHTIGDFTTIALAQQLNLWAGTLPVYSKFILAIITFAVITALGFVLELVVPHIVNGLMLLFLKYNLIYPYKKQEECEYYVVLE